MHDTAVFGTTFLSNFLVNIVFLRRRVILSARDDEMARTASRGDCTLRRAHPADCSPLLRGAQQRHAVGKVSESTTARQPKRSRSALQAPLALHQGLRAPVLPVEGKQVECPKVDSARPGRTHVQPGKVWAPVGIAGHNLAIAPLSQPEGKSAGCRNPTIATASERTIIRRAASPGHPGSAARCGLRCERQGRW